MFPIVEIAVRGLNPDSVYALEMEFVPSSHHRLRFHEGKWLSCGSADRSQSDATPVFRHQESPNYGSHFTGYQVSFGRVKITNRTDSKNLVCLNSHFMYHVQIHVLKVDITADGKKIENHIHTTKLPLTEFIAVTAYQNEMVTALKIKHNPFAKAFQLNHKYKEDCEEHYVKKEIATGNNISAPPANRVVTPSGVTSYKQAAALTASSAASPSPASTISWNNISRNHAFEHFLPNGNRNIPQNNFYPPYSSYDLRWPTNPSPMSTSCLYPSSHRSPINIAQTPYSPALNYATQANSRPLMSPALPCGVEPNLYRQDCVYTEQKEFNLESYNIPHLNQQHPNYSCPYSSIPESCSSGASTDNSPVYNTLTNSGNAGTTSDTYSSSSEELIGDSWYIMNRPT